MIAPPTKQMHLPSVPLPSATHKKEFGCVAVVRATMYGCVLVYSTEGATGANAHAHDAPNHNTTSSSCDVVARSARATVRRVATDVPLRAKPQRQRADTRARARLCALCMPPIPQ
eukprot:1796128-Pyramimonas_sp.AAC.1